MVTIISIAFHATIKNCKVFYRMSLHPYKIFYKIQFEKEEYIVEFLCRKGYKVILYLHIYNILVSKVYYCYNAWYFPCAEVTFNIIFNKIFPFIVYIHHEGVSYN
ncbi:hypothetical protein H311_01092, partial [Anncaliia algerae PRA109]